MNAIEKFRNYWQGLSLYERANMWEILSAIRGPDDANSITKKYTTARIRYELFGKVFAKEIGHHWASVRASIPKKKWPTSKLATTWHFSGHIQGAIYAISRVTKKKMRNRDEILNGMEDY